MSVLLLSCICHFYVCVGLLVFMLYCIKFVLMFVWLFWIYVVLMLVLMLCLCYVVKHS